ncbi:MAG: choice-of-anchor J domain-containing protein, partial [Bacteroidota bacterium]
MQPLPQMIDFEDFDGVNLSEIYPGWQEATGVLQPQYAGGGWFGGDVLFESKTASITFDYLGLNDDWIISSQFIVTETTQLYFEAALTRFWDDPAQGNLSFNDSISIMVSTNTETFDFAHHIFSFKQDNQPGNQLERYDFDLSEFAGELIHLAFYATNGQEANSLGAFHLDNIVIKDAVEKDAMPLSLISPEMNTCLGEQTPVEVEIYNDGTEPVSSIPVKVRVRGVENQNLFGVYPGVLQPGESGEFVVGMMNTSTPGDYRVTVSTELPGDEFTDNDQLPEKLFTKSESLSLPLPVMDFVGFYSDNLGELYPGWYEARGQDTPQIRMDTDWQGSAYNDTRTANVYFTQLGTNDWMVGPLFTATENLVVELRAAVESYQGGTGMGSDDRFAIMVSADCGQTWQQVHAIDQNNAPGEVLENFRFEIPDFAGQQIMLAFYATTGNISDSQQYYFHVTDIEIKNLYSTDAAVTRIISPGSSCEFSENEQLVVEVTNLGSEDISEVDLAYVLNDQNPVVETLSESLSYNESTVYTFNTSLDLTQSEENTISVYTLHDQDENPENDGIFDYPLLLSSFDLSTQGQYTMGFEEDQDFSDWIVEDANNDNTEWELTEDSEYANSGNFSFSYFSNQTSQQSNDWLF